MLQQVFSGSLIICAVALSTGTRPAFAHCSLREPHIVVAPSSPLEYVVPVLPYAYSEPPIVVDRHVTVHRHRHVDRHVTVHRHHHVDRHVNVYQPEPRKPHGHGQPRGQRTHRQRIVLNR